MNENETIQPTKRNVPFGAIAVILAGLLIVVWLITGNNYRPLKPLRPTATPGALDLNSQPVIVTFDELNADPNAFRDQTIRITGAYTPQEKPGCFNYSGPLIRWALISSDLQLNGRGFESVLALVPPGTTLTIDGVWRLYFGPVGCGKGPTNAQVWYLQVERIVQPNPLPNFDGTPQEGAPDPATTAVPDNNDPTPTPEPGTTVLPSPTSPTPQEQTISPTPTPLFNATATTFLTATPTVTATSDGRFTATPSVNGTATITPTPNAFATSTPTPGNNPTNTPIATPPSLITATPGPSPTPDDGYPGPPTPPSGTPTVTPDPYPPT